MSQNLEALAQGQEIRIEAARQRRELINAPVDVVAAALRHPTPEFGRYRLRTIILPRGSGKGCIVPGVGSTRLQRVFHRLAADPTLGRISWHPELRLDELSERERARLVEELIAAARSSWSQRQAA